MIVCHCQHITDRDIQAAIDWMRAADAQSIITPGRVYHALGKSPECGGCISHFVATMRQDDRVGVPPDLCNLRSQQEKDVHHEGQRQGY